MGLYLLALSLWLSLSLHPSEAQIPVVCPGSVATGVYATQSDFHQGTYQLHFNAQSVAATLTSTRSLVQYFARQQPIVLFTVPEGYGPAQSSTIEVEGSPVTPDGSPHPTSTAPRRFRPRVVPDGTVRYVNDAGVDGVE